MGRKYGSIILIVFGLGYLLYNLNIISFSPWSLLWPCLIIWFSASQLVHTKKRESGPETSWEIALWLVALTFGIYLLLPKLGVSTPTIPWKIIWPAILIAIGTLKLLWGKPHYVKYEYTSSTGQRINKNVHNALVGEFNRGPGSWLLEDLRLHQTVGSINLDLTQAIIPNREVELDIYGLVGDTNIYLPPDLPFKAHCSINLGEITVLDHSESGTQRVIERKTGDFDDATQKVNIKVHMRIGDINIRQIR